MSTNFYAKHIPTESDYKTMQEALTARQLEKLAELLHDAKKIYPIGKRSGGWQFEFVPHIDQSRSYHCNEVNHPWEDTLSSMKEYLSRDDIQIYDEYGKHYTCEQFFEEIAPVLYHDPKTAINGADSDKMKPNKYYRSEEMEYTTKEGLRFSKDSDWS